MPTFRCLAPARSFTFPLPPTRKPARTSRALELRARGAALGALALLLAALAATAAGAATLAVAAGAVAVANNGVCSLREAIHNANDDAQVDNTDCPAGSGADTIQLAAASTYALPDADPVDASNGLPTITSTIVLAGNGATIERSGGLTCFLDGALQIGEFRLLRSSGDLTLEHLTLRNGCIDGDGGSGYGGALYAGGTLTLDGVVVDGNRSAEGSGGLATVAGGLVSIVASTFSNNFANGAAGAIGNGEGVSMTITGSTITGNSAGAGGAGGIGNFGTLTVFNSTVVGNTAQGAGGGIRNGSGTLELDAVTISSNKTIVALGGGGLSNSGTLTVKNSIVAGNFEGGDCASVAPGTFTALGQNLDEDGTCAALDAAHFTRVTATQLALAPPSFSPGAGALAPLYGSVAVSYTHLTLPTSDLV